MKTACPNCQGVSISEDGQCKACGAWIIGIGDSVDCVDGLVYLAAPYTDPNPVVRQERLGQINLAAAVLMASGYLVYSPVSHGQAIATAAKLPTNWGYWGKHCETILSACSSVMVLRLAGWGESEGLQQELALAKAKGLPINYLDANSDGIPPSPEIPQNEAENAPENLPAAILKAMAEAFERGDMRIKRATGGRIYIENGFCSG